MNTNLRRCGTLLLTGLTAIALLGCATMRPLSSKPPLAKVVLPAPFTVRAWQGVLPPTPYSVILPQGEYRPLYEDDQAYYYQAPSKLVVNDLTSLLYDGGVYVLRGTSTLRGWYYIGEDGSQSFGKFTTPPPTR